MTILKSELFGFEYSFEILFIYLSLFISRILNSCSSSFSLDAELLLFCRRLFLLLVSHSALSSLYRKMLLEADFVPNVFRDFLLVFGFCLVSNYYFLLKISLSLCKRRIIFLGSTFFYLVLWLELKFLSRGLRLDKSAWPRRLPALLLFSFARFSFFSSRIGERYCTANWGDKFLSLGFHYIICSYYCCCASFDFWSNSRVCFGETSYSGDGSSF